MENYLLFQQMKSNIDLLEESFTQQEINNNNKCKEIKYISHSRPESEEQIVLVEMVDIKPKILFCDHHHQSYLVRKVWFQHLQLADLHAAWLQRRLQPVCEC